MTHSDSDVLPVPASEAGPAGAAAVLPIREIAERTGVNPVTLRAWERRYGLLVPARTDKGHRLYSEADVQRVRDIQAWLARGVAIGKVRPLLDRGDETGQAMGNDAGAGTGDGWDLAVQETLDVAMRFEPAALQHHLEQLFAAYPPAVLLDHWLVPLHRELSRRTRFGSSVLRSFFWSQLQVQLARAERAGRRGLSAGSAGGRLLLLSFPGIEQQAFATLFCNGLLAAGIDTLHLGPLEESSEMPYAMEKLRARGVICYSHNALPMSILADTTGCALRIMRQPLWFAGGIVELQWAELASLLGGQPGEGGGHKSHLDRLLSLDTGRAITQLQEGLA